MLSGQMEGLAIEMVMCYSTGLCYSEEWIIQQLYEKNVIIKLETECGYFNVTKVAQV